MPFVPLRLRVGLPFGGTPHSRLKFGPTRRSALQFLFAGIRVIRGQNFRHPVSNFRSLPHSRFLVFYGRAKFLLFSANPILMGSSVPIIGIRG
jgi:hypothetical protein